jgi:hypothetical protein
MTRCDIKPVHFDVFKRLAEVNHLKAAKLERSLRAFIDKEACVSSRKAEWSLIFSLRRFTTVEHTPKGAGDEIASHTKQHNLLTVLSPIEIFSISMNAFIIYK